jgi:IS1 family transposase
MQPTWLMEAIRITSQQNRWKSDAFLEIALGLESMITTGEWSHYQWARDAQRMVQQKIKRKQRQEASDHHPSHHVLPLSRNTAPRIT